jgi:hypothetical protein
MTRFPNAALLICVFCLFPLAASAETDANTLLKNYDTATPKDKEDTRNAILLTVIGIEWANTFLKVQRKEASLSCTPKNLVPTGEQ